jgi:cell division protein FtsB
MFRLSNWLARQWPNLMLSAVLVGLLANALFSAMGPRDLLMLRARRAELERQRASLTAQKTGLETTVQNLRSNDRYIEHLIRRELGYARSDEVIYKFTGAAADSSKTSAESQSNKVRKSVLAGLTLQLLSELGLANK